MYFVVMCEGVSFLEGCDRAKCWKFSFCFFVLFLCFARDSFSHPAISHIAPVVKLAIPPSQLTGVG